MPDDSIFNKLAVILLVVDMIFALSPRRGRYAFGGDSVKALEEGDTWKMEAPLILWPRSLVRRYTVKRAR